MIEATRAPDEGDPEPIEHTQESKITKDKAREPVKISSIIKRKPPLGGGLANSLKRKKV
jgi:hypothetical protein